MKKAVLLLLLLVACQQAVEQPAPVYVPKPAPPPVALPPPPEPPVPNESEIAPELFCIDSDNGFNEFEKGFATSQTDNVSDSCLSVKAQGRMVPLKKVIEYACDEDKIVAEVRNCEHGCKDGACLREPLPGPNFTPLIQDGQCNQGLTVGNAIQVSTCYNDCLSATVCQKGEAKSSSVTLPWQLSCLARSEQFIQDKWLEFDILREQEFVFEAEVLGSEYVSVTIHNAQGAMVAALLNQEPVAINRCFGYGRGQATAMLPPGHYEVRVGAMARSPHLMRSFVGQSFSVAII